LESTLPFMLSDTSDHCQCCDVESNVRTMAPRSTRKPPLRALS
jgi:hypothetical protein